MAELGDEDMLGLLGDTSGDPLVLVLLLLLKKLLNLDNERVGVVFDCDIDNVCLISNQD